MIEHALMSLALASGEMMLAVDPSGLSRAATAVPAESPQLVSIIPVMGALAPRGFRGFFGSVQGMDGLQAQIRSAAANPDIATIVLHIDSPGGTVRATPETAAAVREASTQKRVIAVADGLAASAAYWIGSQASEFVVTPSSEVGSIGILAVHRDVSKALEQAGIKTTVLTDAPYKGEGNPFGPLSEEAIAHHLARIAATGDDFRAAVAAGRKTTPDRVKAEFGQGRLVDAKDALSLGMVDRVATLRDVLAGLASQKRSLRRSAALA